MKNNGYIVLTVLFSQEQDGTWLAECRELGTAIQADTFEKAKEIIGEAILMHLNELEQVGERERFFRENNIYFVSDKENQRQISVNLPFNLKNSQVVQPFVHQMAGVQ